MDMMPMTPPPTYNNQSSMPMMHASFFWGKDVIILFSDWPGQDRISMYVLALAMVFLLSMTVEIVSGSLSLKPRGSGSGSVKPAAFVYAVVYAVKMALAYLVMLSVMSFNVGCFLAAVFGHGIGCFVAKYRALVVISKAADSI